MASKQDSLPPGARRLRRILVFFLVVLFATYVLDFVWLKLRSAYPSLGMASSSIHRVRIFAIQGKAGKTEYQTDSIRPEEDIPCVRSIFPHSGQQPCWYVERHANDPIPI